MSDSGRGFRRVAVGVVLVLVALLTWWILAFDPSRNRKPDDGDAKAPVVETKPGQSWAPRVQRPPTPGCAARAGTTCVDGDSWWVDSCGEAYEIATECGHRPCTDGACEPDAPGGCGDVTALGQCDREVARICQVDRVLEVDCRAQRKRCVMTSEGPLCREPTDDDCRPGEPSRCDGKTLKTCVEGRWSSYDCDALGGICLPARDGAAPRCVYALPVLDADCGACGCPPEPSAEVCDGQDNDADGSIDEDVACEPVPVVAFVIGETASKSNYTDEDVKAAIEETNAAFVREDGLGIEFELLSIQRIGSSAWLELDMKDVHEMLTRGVLDGASPDFYVPVVFTDEVLAEEVPRPGLATVPNGFCGGQRRIWERQPDVGLVAVAKRRWPTTLAHEMGHFLGLCHTHEAPPPIERVGSDEAIADAEACDERCRSDPDGLCDTVIDPGPEACGVDAECTIHCETGDRPDPSNMMGYYPPCRTLFSEEQALLMRQSLALRRGWHACFGNDGCACDPAAQDCPESMTCRPYVGTGSATDWRCDLDGASLPGGRCKFGSDCGDGSICVQTPLGEGRCARTCSPLASPCKCEPITTPQVAVCSEDLRLDPGG
ncbi:MAG TPA: M43 family zinc metalloprotease [Nannocystaceae bacterium]|nr:M43 family zinc metalloprotease [Nannocystaceae bacterium]